MPRVGPLANNVPGAKSRARWEPTGSRGLFRAATATCLLAGLSACSSQPDTNEAATGHDRRTIPELVGQHIYACNDGSQLDVDFLTDGLTIDLTPLPGGTSRRLTAPATGLPFVGEGMTVNLSNGEIVILRADEPVQTCRRVRTASHPAGGGRLR